MFAAAAALDLDDPVLKVQFAGVDLASRFDLAAGFDKDCELIGAPASISIPPSSIRAGASRGGSIPRSPRCCDSSARPLGA